MKDIEFTKDDIAFIKNKIYLSEMQEKILDYKLEGNYTEDGMALKLHTSKSTIQYQWRKVKKKISKVF